MKIFISNQYKYQLQDMKDKSDEIAAIYIKELAHIEIEFILVKE